MAEVDYGLDADLKAKRDAKYDHDLEKEVTVWVEEVTGDKKGDQDFGDWLKSGVVLCNLVNSIKPGTIGKINTSSMPFKQMENITFFMNAARNLGVPESSMFGTPDLYEGKNLGSVCHSLYALGGTVQVAVPEFTGPQLGVAINVESKDKKRDGHLLTDQSQGFSTKLEVERPTDGTIIRGQAAIPPQLAAGDSSGSTPSPAPERVGAVSAGASPKLAAEKAATSSTTATSHSPAKVAEAPAPAKTTEGDDCTYGLDAELKAKQDAKYDVSLEMEVTEWIEAVTGEKRGGQDLHAWLKNGVVLCNLANKVKPGSVHKINTSSLAFKQMENITFFMKAARDMGVPESAMFGTPDLYEEKNMGSVVNCIYTYGGAIQAALPSFMPKLGIALNVDSHDKKRSNGFLTDQSAGLSTAIEVQRPH